MNLPALHLLRQNFPKAWLTLLADRSVALPDPVLDAPLTRPAGQETAVVVPAFERLLREAAPAGAEVQLDLWTKCEPGLVAPDSPAIRIAQDAFEESMGVRPLLIRTGGSISIVATLATLGMPVIVTGLSLSESNVHSPNERIPASYLDLGVRTVRELLRRLAELG